MKQVTKYSALLVLTLLMYTACSEGEQDIPEKATFIEIEDVFAATGEMEADLSGTRAVSDYKINNTNYDPTRSLPAKGDRGWLLDLEIYYDYGDGNGEVRYEPGCGVLKYDRYYSASSYTYGYWRLKDDSDNDKLLFLPNYKKQKFQAMLYPDGWKSEGGFVSNPNWEMDIPSIVLDQRNLEVFRKQDILVAHMGAVITGSIPTLTPQKSFSMVFKHYYTMLNFKLGEIDYARIASVKVLVDNENNGSYTEYIPWEVTHLATGVATGEGEYMVIIYPNKGNIQIALTTNDGIEYRQQLVFPSGHNSLRGLQNYCYCFTLTGVQLTLSPVTVKDWSTGETIWAGYTSETAYPTFMGPENATFTLHYDTGLTQEITFSSQGEYMGKPAGRTIIGITYNGISRSLSPPVVLDGMLIDLTGYF